jgi:hypothetical protein
MRRDLSETEHSFADCNPLETISIGTHYICPSNEYLLLEKNPGKLPSHAKGLQISTPEAVLQRLVKTRSKNV